MHLDQNASLSGLSAKLLLLLLSPPYVLDVFFALFATPKLLLTLQLWDFPFVQQLNRPSVIVVVSFLSPVILHASFWWQHTSHFFIRTGVSAWVKRRVWWPSKKGFMQTNTVSKEGKTIFGWPVAASQCNDTLERTSNRGQQSSVTSGSGTLKKYVNQAVRKADGYREYGPGGEGAEARTGSYRVRRLCWVF